MTWLEISDSVLQARVVRNPDSSPNICLPSNWQCQQTYFLPTLSSSFLSSLRAKTRLIVYIPRMTHTVDNTTKFPDSARLPNAANTLSKSMGFGATKKSPPNADRCVQRHCNCFEVVFGPTCTKRISDS